ncbi:hypothetical protein CN587_18470 [Bacillus wiedmannii]|uniref:hypothetical protein n=1 Tax=Bacillus wiedmannii TaxID=1890302 RepID=UPI000BF0FDEE|nr:hypothetical protein [Bacillus wiedmannii]PEO16414.1 hypothetical protein CN562_05675 [Bacillus wiedmannii]PEQ03304.1 hypothetical protein CN587_18470 [Bacillus wiedmannii]PFX61613.1 hypothetical protein COL36_10410 [Bacillus wiedmannii]
MKFENESSIEEAKNIVMDWLAMVDIEARYTSYHKIAIEVFKWISYIQEVDYEVDIRQLNYLVTYYLDAIENVKNNNPSAEHNYPLSDDIKKAVGEYPDFHEDPNYDGVIIKRESLELLLWHFAKVISTIRTAC